MINLNLTHNFNNTLNIKTLAKVMLEYNLTSYLKITLESIRETLFWHSRVR